MRISFGAVVLLSSLGLLAACGPPPPIENVQLSTPSAFDTPLDGRWRKAATTRPMAVLLGRAETTRTIAPRRAALLVNCYRGRKLLVAFDFGLGKGPISVAYRLDAKTAQSGTVRVRGRDRNTLQIDYPPTATAFVADLGTSTTLTVRASRPPFQVHDAHFNWNRDDKVLKELLASCKARMLDSGPRQDAETEAEEDQAIGRVIKEVLPEQ